MKGILRVKPCISTSWNENREVEPRSVISCEKLTQMLPEGKCPEFRLQDFQESRIKHV